MRNKLGSSAMPALVALGVALAAAIGCQKPEPPPAAYVGPTLGQRDLGLERAECAPTGFVILETQASRGRFPGALAVARLVPAADDASSGGASLPCWRLGTIKEEQATYWNSLFNSVRDIREVVILDVPSVERPEAGLTDITVAAFRAKAGVCLIWGPTAAAPNHAALMGVIMDAEQLKPVAVVRADAGPADFRKPAPDQFKQDRRHEDVNYLVARKFDQQVKDCMFELIARDEEPPSTQPSPYHFAVTTQPAGHPAVPVYIVPNRPAGW